MCFAKIRQSMQPRPLSPPQRRPLPPTSSRHSANAEAERHPYLSWRSTARIPIRWRRCRRARFRRRSNTGFGNRGRRRRFRLDYRRGRAWPYRSRRRFQNLGPDFGDRLSRYALVRIRPHQRAFEASRIDELRELPRFGATQDIDPWLHGIDRTRGGGRSDGRRKARANGRRRKGNGRRDRGFDDGPNRDARRLSRVHSGDRPLDEASQERADEIRSEQQQECLQKQLIHK